jgi:iron complex outermembrane receptor protein
MTLHFFKTWTNHYRKLPVIASGCLLATLTWQSISFAEPAEGVLLDPATVKDKKESLAIEPNPNATSTQETISKKALDNLLGPAQTGSYKALEMLPAVNEQSADAFGLALGKTMRIRGSYEADAFIRNIEGLPVSSHGGGGDFIDFENVQSVSVYRGGMPVENSLGVRNLTGLMDLSLLWPKETFGVTVKQGVGSEGFLRSYARLDSGLLGSGTKLFASYSWTAADKWRGAGGSPDGRHNAEVGISQQLGSKAKVDIFGVYHELDQHDFRGLTYAQASNLGQYRNFDYNSALTGVPSTDQNYYDFTRQHYRDAMVLANIEIKPTADSRITIKPYYWNDEGYRLIGRGNGYSRLDINPQQYGFVAQYDISLPFVDATLGYWFMEGSDTLPPPLSQKMFALTPGQPGAATFSSWSQLAKIEDRVYHSPYLNLKKTFGEVEIMAGIRYSLRVNPKTTFYKTAGLPDVSYDDVFKYNPQIDPGMQISERTWEDWLPSFGANYRINPDLSTFFSYAKAYNYDAWPGQISTFVNNRTAFTNAGVSFDDIWNKLRPESLDNFDLGLHYRHGDWSVSPTLYYTIHQHKTVTVFDQVIGVPYLQSNANATSYGAELEITGRPVPDYKPLSFYLSTSWGRHEFDKDIKTASNTVVSTKGKQVPDTPEWLVKFGPTWENYGFSVTPLLRYTGTRYGDTENKEKIGGYTVVDLHLAYTLKELLSFKKFTVGLDFINLFDRTYVGQINTSDFALSNSINYYPGAPFTVMSSITADF